MSRSPIRPGSFAAGSPRTSSQRGQRWRRSRAGPVAGLGLAACLGVAACGGAGPPAADEPTGPADEAQATAELSPQNWQVVDLTHELSPDSIYWPTGRPFEHEILSWGADAEGDWYAAAAFSTPEHLGTHLDAPVHFHEGGWTSAEIPADRLVAPGIVVDISERAAVDPDATLQPDDLVRWERRHGDIPAGAVVIVRTGWSERWPDWNAYYGSDTPEDVGTLHFPGVSEEAARLLAQRRVAGVGIDTASIDPGPSRRFQAHRVLAAADVFNLENLTNVAGLPPSGFVVVAAAPKIVRGTGGPTRVLALLPSQEGAENP